MHVDSPQTTSGVLQPLLSASKYSTPIDSAVIHHAAETPNSPPQGAVDDGVSGSESHALQDDYEPRLDDDLDSRRSSGLAKSTYSADDELDVQAPDHTRLDAPVGGKVSDTLGGLEAAHVESIHSSSREEGQTSRSTSSVDISDSDDYEPPEPNILVDDAGASPRFEASNLNPVASEARNSKQVQTDNPPEVSQTTQKSSTDDNDRAKTVASKHRDGEFEEVG